MSVPAIHEPNAEAARLIKLLAGSNKKGLLKLVPLGKEKPPHPSNKTAFVRNGITTII